jgi:hypothetical protein
MRSSDMPKRQPMPVDESAAALAAELAGQIARAEQLLASAKSDGERKGIEMCLADWRRRHAEVRARAGTPH